MTFCVSGMSNKNIAFALCHGWGFDAHSLARLRQLLLSEFSSAHVVAFDIGFTGHQATPELAADKHWIAVGHSYGFSYLMQQSVAWYAAISLNGFTTFCKREDRPEGVPIRAVDTMLANLHGTPHAVLKRFYQHCKAPWPVPERPDTAALHEHLTRLRDLDIEPPACKVLSFITSGDAVGPPALGRACFPSPKHITHEFPGHHMSLLLEPEECMHRITEFAEELDD
jgi:hypothetical protein